MSQLDHIQVRCNGYPAGVAHGPIEFTTWAFTDQSMIDDTERNLLRAGRDCCLEAYRHARAVLALRRTE